MAPTRESLPRTAKTKIQSYAVLGGTSSIRKPRRRVPQPVSARPQAAPVRPQAVPARGPVQHPGRPTRRPVYATQAAMNARDAGGEELAPPDQHLCHICYRTIPPDSLPKACTIPAECREHLLREACQSCILRALTANLTYGHGDFYPIRHDEGTGDLLPGSSPIGCPVCSAAWDLAEVGPHWFAPADMAVFAHRATAQALERDPSFRWCPRDTCVAGQMFDLDAVRRDAKVCCNLCGSLNCYACRVEWHEGITCDEFRAGAARRDSAVDDHAAGAETAGEGDGAIVKAIRQHETRYCPCCNVGIEKTYGCNHMTCSNCGKSFQWENAALI